MPQQRGFLHFVLKAIDDTQYSASDHSATIKWTNFFLTASNMPDNKDGRQSDRVRYVFGWIMVIGTDGPELDSAVLKDAD